MTHPYICWSRGEPILKWCLQRELRCRLTPQLNRRKVRLEECVEPALEFLPLADYILRTSRRILAHPIIGGFEHLCVRLPLGALQFRHLVKPLLRSGGEIALAVVLRSASRLVLASFEGS